MKTFGILLLLVILALCVWARAQGEVLECTRVVYTNPVDPTTTYEVTSTGGSVTVLSAPAVRELRDGSLVANVIPDVVVLPTRGGAYVEGSMEFTGCDGDILTVAPLKVRVRNVKGTPHISYRVQR